LFPYTTLFRSLVSLSVFVCQKGPPSTGGPAVFKRRLERAILQVRAELIPENFFGYFLFLFRSRADKAGQGHDVALRYRLFQNVLPVKFFHAAILGFLLHLCLARSLLPFASVCSGSHLVA